MAGIVYKYNNKYTSLTGSEYTQPNAGTARLCIKYSTSTVKYGLTTNSSASQYCGIRMKINGNTAYIGRRESSQGTVTSSSVGTWTATSQAYKDVEKTSEYVDSSTRYWTETVQRESVRTGTAQVNGSTTYRHASRNVVITSIKSLVSSKASAVTTLYYVNSSASRTGSLSGNNTWTGVDGAYSVSSTGYPITNQQQRFSYSATNSIISSSGYRSSILYSTEMSKQLVNGGMVGSSSFEKFVPHSTETHFSQLGGRSSTVTSSIWNNVTATTSSGYGYYWSIGHLTRFTGYNSSYTTYQATRVTTNISRSTTIATKSTSGTAQNLLSKITSGAHSTVVSSANSWRYSYTGQFWYYSITTSTSQEVNSTVTWNEEVPKSEVITWNTFSTYKDKVSYQDKITKSSTNYNYTFTSSTSSHNYNI